MGMPALEGGPYIFNVNNLFSESNDTDKQKRWMLEVKNQLVAVGGAVTIWAVTASSDGSAYVNKGGGSPDLWDTISDIVPNSAGNAHSWAILENQTTGGELLLDCAYIIPQSYNIRYSPGGLYGTGDASNAPTATDDRALVTIDDRCNWYGTNYKKIVVNVMVSADHKTTIFCVQDKEDTTESQGTFVGMIAEVLETPSAWISTNKTVVLSHSEPLRISTTPENQSPYLGDLQFQRWYCYLETNEPYAGWAGCNPLCESYGSFAADGANGIFSIEEELELQEGYPMSAIGLFRSPEPYGGIYGRVRDVYILTPSLPTFSQYPNDSSRAWIKFGCFLLPWDGSIPVEIP